MGDSGRKLADGLHLLRLTKFFLQQFVGGNVARDAHQPDNFPSLVAQRHLGSRNPDHPTIHPSPFFLFVYQRLPRGHHLLVICVILTGLFSREKFHIATPHHFGGVAQTKGFGLRRVDLDKFACPVFEINMIRNVRDQAVQQIPLLRQRGLRLLALRDVLHQRPDV